MECEIAKAAEHATLLTQINNDHHIYQLGFGVQSRKSNYNNNWKCRTQTIPCSIQNSARKMTWRQEKQTWLAPQIAFFFIVDGFRSFRLRCPSSVKCQRRADRRIECCVTLKRKLPTNDTHISSHKKNPLRFGHNNFLQRVDSIFLLLVLAESHLCLISSILSFNYVNHENNETMIKAMVAARVIVLCSSRSRIVLYHYSS